MRCKTDVPYPTSLILYGSLEGRKFDRRKISGEVHTTTTTPTTTSSSNVTTSCSTTTTTTTTTNAAAAATRGSVIC
jgi:hypothetical protein